MKRKNINLKYTSDGIFLWISFQELLYSEETVAIQQVIAACGPPPAVSMAVV